MSSVMVGFFIFAPQSKLVMKSEEERSVDSDGSDAIKPFTTVEEFLFQEPLYQRLDLAGCIEEIEVLYRRQQRTADGHCPFCCRQSTFAVSGQGVPGGDPWNNIQSRKSFDTVSLICARDREHALYYFVRIDDLIIQKVGQLPSLADIANDESKTFRNVLERSDSRELHMAIGLAAHGVGIGSFVYLRRIFERLILKRFTAHKDAMGWQDAEFVKLRMAEKITFLSSFLPAFMVKNAIIYNILSKGVHELNESECLKYFEILKQSIVWILQQDQEAKAEAEKIAAYTKAITQISGSISSV
ncbi:hypothetical protein [Methylocella sp. CPCC 101449]|uniref:hypothetical protein n=1 Tax=Methylocella sp. CPCC 101449 TaxID=2987531 RepID=UPI00288E987C|nr:hypothetical protein [Methylocella sp. CPCC 101449]MDT2019746.1 hypothetical protein [Methylocella sp. CPCC 101449]